MTDETVWASAEWVRQTQRILDSYARLLGRELIERCGDRQEDSRALFEADVVVVSHGTESDPILNYGNRAALKLWEADVAELLQMPSRKTAEPLHRDERAELLRRVTTDGYIDDYRGIRISTTGKRFLIREAVVWNLSDETGQHCGQAATFSEWEYLEP